MWRKPGPERTREIGYGGEDMRGRGGAGRRRWSARRVLGTAFGLDVLAAFAVWAMATGDGSSDDGAGGLVGVLELTLGLGLLSSVVAGPILTVVGVKRLRAERTQSAAKSLDAKA